MAKDKQAGLDQPSQDGDARAPSKASSKMSVTELGSTLDVQQWKHRAAASLHGWIEHAHHSGKPMELTAEDYQLAIEAAITGSGDMPHAPARSEFYGKGL